MVNLRAKIEDEWFRNAAKILIYHPGFDGEIKDVALPVESLSMKTVEAGEVINPTMTLSIAFLQSLVDELYRVYKMTPTSIYDEIKERSGILDATKYHLEDMRSLVFRK